MSKEPDGDFNRGLLRTGAMRRANSWMKPKEALLDYLVANMPNPDNLQEEDGARSIRFMSFPAEALGK